MDTKVFVNNVLIDLKADIPLPITYTIADITQPDKRNTSFSKTIILPFSKTNDALFGYIFEIGKESITDNSEVNFTPDFNPNLKADIKIFKGNLLQFQGVLKLTEINTLKREYSTNCFGSLKDLFLAVEGLKLQDLDMSEYDHTWDRDTMKLSWDTEITKNGSPYVNFSAGLPTGEGYVYPTIDYGYRQSPTKIRTKYSYPAIYVREYMSKIFALAGFTWDSDVFDSTLFRKLIIPYVGEIARLSPSEALRREFRVSKTGTQSESLIVPPVNILYPFSLPQRVLTTFQNESTGGNFDNWPAFAANAWACPVTGYYNFTTTITAEANSTIASKLGIVYEIISFNGTTAPKTLASINSQSTTDVTTFSYTGAVSAINKKINKGDVVYVLTGVFGASSLGDTIDLDITAGTFFNTTVTAPLEVGGTMSVNSMIPPDINIKDFLTSIIKMFNLYIQPDPVNPKILNIEPLVDFYNTSETLDWTSKIDYSKDVLIRPCSAIEGKRYIFKYKEDKDYYNENYRNQYGIGYGDRQIDIRNDFVSESKITELIFSATPSFGVTTNNMVIPRIIKQNETTLAVEPYRANIRILIYGGVLDAGGTWRWLNDESGTHTESTYAYAGHLDHPFTPTFDLLFDMPRQIYWGSPADIGAGYTNNNLYNKYWSQFINEITDKDSKLVSLYTHIRAIDIFNLDFRKPIYIDGINYRLNKIIDYDPDKDDSFLVEVSKIKRYKTFSPTTEEVISSGDPVIFDIVEGGLDEVRSLTPVTNIMLIDGGKDAVIGITGGSNINIINGGIS